VVRASNSKRDCDALSLLLPAAAVRSFVHMPLGISDRNNIMWECPLAKLHKQELHIVGNYKVLVLEILEGCLFGQQQMNQIAGSYLNQMHCCFPMVKAQQLKV